MLSDRGLLLDQMLLFGVKIDAFLARVNGAKLWMAPAR